MKTKHLFLIAFCFIIAYSCFNPVDPETTTGTLVFQGVTDLPVLSKHIPKAYGKVKMSGVPAIPMEMTDMEFDIHEMYISQSIIDTGIADTFTWHLIADNIGLTSIEDVDFMAQNIPTGRYNSLKIVFTNHVIRHGRFVADTTQTMEFESNLGETLAPDNSFLINYFGAGGSYYYDNDSSEFVSMAAGENMPPYDITAGATTTIYWKAGGEDTYYTDITFDWIDDNDDSLWTAGVDSIRNVEGPPGMPMWTFLVVEE